MTRDRQAGATGGTPAGVAILGSTGSIGTSALRVLARQRDRFVPVALTANGNVAALAEQVATWRPSFVGLVQSHADAPDGWAVGADCLVAAATHPDAQIVINAVVGAAGLPATLAALRMGKRVALANKETLVVAGAIVMETARAHGGELVPVDSEHSAILQCLAGRQPHEVRRLVLTASGGPFRTWPAERIAAAGAALEGRLAGAESTLGARMQALEAAQTRIAGIEARATRLQAIAALRARLDAGQALGPSLGAFPNAPAALSRFASAAPPTESGLRLAFEDAARAARAASEPAREGQSILESASARLAGLVTIRRGETVIWGDEAAAALEAARRALEAGDLPGALGKLAPLPPNARAALGAWEAEAQALLAARAALLTLAGG